MERHKSARYHMLWYNDGPVPTTYPGPTRSPGAGSYDGFSLRQQLMHRPSSCGNHSTLRLATPCAEGTNASGLAVVAHSASLAGSMPEVTLARAGAAPTTSNAPPSLCAVTPRGSTSPASATSATPAGPRGSESSVLLSWLQG